MKKTGESTNKGDVVLILKGSDLFVDIKAPHSGKIA